jgi:hypothetical protein
VFRRQQTIDLTSRPIGLRFLCAGKKYLLVGYDFRAREGEPTTVRLELREITPEERALERRAWWEDFWKWLRQPVWESR